MPKDSKILEITKVEYLSDYKLNLLFNDGKRQIVDFEPFLKKSHHPEIQKYLDLNIFKQFRIRNGTLDWNDYDLCFPMADLYTGKIIKDSLTGEKVPPHNEPSSNVF